MEKRGGDKTRTKSHRGTSGYMISKMKAPIVVRQPPEKFKIFCQMGNVFRKFILRQHTSILLLISIMLLTLGIHQQNSLHASDVIMSKKGTGRSFNDETVLLKPCPLLPAQLGLVGTIPVNLTAPSWEELERMYPSVERGGKWRPADCVSRSRVAIVIPYRNRDYNLRAFLQHMHAFLQKQKLQYGIIVAEQAGNATFNRGFMRNVGFKEANSEGEYDCTVFHDVDLLPENDMNYYGCSDIPRHMCVALDYFKYKPIANGAVFGGIVSFRNDQFWRVNGYSNLYFGWGGEDDDLMSRCRRTGVGFYRARPQYGRYVGTPHHKDHRTASTYQMWMWREGRAVMDGLNSLQYKVIRREQKTLFTWILVEVDEEKYQKEASKYLAKMQTIQQNATRNMRRGQGSAKNKTTRLANKSSRRQNNAKRRVKSQYLLS